MRRDDEGPYSLDELARIPLPALFTTEASAWADKLVAWFEQASGRKLYPMQVEMLLIETLAYAMSVMGVEAQLTAEQHLVAFATDVGLEKLGPNRSTPRLPASKAQVMLRFSIETARVESTFIPAGTRVGPGDGLAFVINAPVIIAAGALFADVIGVADVVGPDGNGFLPGQITTLLDPVAGVSVTNITESRDGADIEATELYRLRIANAFEHISTGGSWAWYRETTFGVSSAIVDVAIIRPSPCLIDIYPLTLAGPASQTLRDQVFAIFGSSDNLDTRFGDDIHVKPPVAVVASPVLTIGVRATSTSVQADAAAAANAVLKAWRERLGAIIAPSEVEAAVKKLSPVVDASITNLSLQQLGREEFLIASISPAAVNVVVLP